jgi:hypothetical protein
MPSAIHHGEGTTGEIGPFDGHSDCLKGIPMRVAVLLTGALMLTALVPAVAPAQNAGETRVMNAFVRHGMPPDTARCFGQVIEQMLGPDETIRAAAIVEAAPNGEAIQQGVMNSTQQVMNAFAAAHNRCGP